MKPATIIRRAASTEPETEVSGDIGGATAQTYVVAASTEPETEVSDDLNTIGVER